MTEAGSGRSFVTALGFAMAVTMWAAAYVGRLPAVMAPGWLILAAMLGAVAGWGWTAGRYTARGWTGGLAVGLSAGILNLLILGSLLSSPDGAGVVPSALWWIPGSLLVVGAVAAAAAAVAAAGRVGPQRELDWTALFSKVAVVATFLLVAAGGLVTSHEAGLAVVDWPNTFGSNMFLYPLARMTGGVYYEHAHRLFGSLVGLTTVVLAVHLWRREERRWVNLLALLAVVVVVAQGILGGLRVTGRFTLATDAEVMAPNIWLAVLHGVLGQLFLAMVVALAAVTSRAWKQAAAPRPLSSAGADRSLHTVLLAVLVLQLVLGAVQRHLAQGIMIHIVLAAVVTVIAVVAGARAWGLDLEWPLPQLGQWLIGTVTVQVFLGIAALAVTQGQAVVGAPTVLEVSLATLHQACGAVLLGVAVCLTLWSRRHYGLAQE